MNEDDLPKAPPGPKWMTDKPDQKVRSDKHERRIAKRMGGRRMPMSGGMKSRPFQKTAGDVSTPEWAIEHKRTDNQSMSVKKEWLKDVADWANRSGKSPAIVMTFDAPGSKPYDWAIIPFELFVKLTQDESDGQ